MSSSGSAKAIGVEDGRSRSRTCSRLSHLSPYKREDPLVKALFIAFNSLLEYLEEWFQVLAPVRALTRRPESRSECTSRVSWRSHSCSLALGRGAKRRVGHGLRCVTYPDRPNPEDGAEPAQSCPPRVVLTGCHVFVHPSRACSSETARSGKILLVTSWDRSRGNCKWKMVGSGPPSD